ncbi:mediator of RNA polymerase II transcription subunit 11-like [Ptychodera flava]|uniref:mediator of RNA polymerase II transcription subunit 11-like n=1 Tax=Ptychodera flava TaxID=63121 RepID=UPI00396A6BA5
MASRDDSDLIDICRSKGNVFFLSQGDPDVAKLSKMATLSGVTERLQQLENIEKEIAIILRSAGQSLQELSKDKPNEKIVEHHTKQFLKSLEMVESGLSKQINYLTQVSTGHPHEGSSYSAQKDTRMAIHRLDHAKCRLDELAKACSHHQ